MFVVRIDGRVAADGDACLAAWRSEAGEADLAETACLPADGARALCFSPAPHPAPPAGRGLRSSDGRLLLFDGVLRHRGRLRAELGLDAAPRDDLALYAEAGRRWADEAPAHLHGDFAALSWDPATARLEAFTDHAGGRRLFYAQLPDGGLCLATHLPLLLATPGLDRRLDGLALGVVPLSLITPADTAFLAVEMLQGGRRLQFRPGSRAQPGRWWQPARPDPSARRPSAAEAAEAIAPLFEEVVAEHLDADGPVATMLSGGLDSTLVAGHAARRLLAEGRPLHAYTAVPHPGLVAASRPGWDASDWQPASLLAARYPNIRHVAVHAGTPCLIDSFRQWHQSGASPVRNSANCQWIDKMAADARDHGCRTLLGGGKGNATISVDGGADALNALLAAGALGELWQALRRAEASLPRQLVRMVRAAWRHGRPVANRALGGYAPIPASAIAAPVLAARRRALVPTIADIHASRTRVVQVGSVLVPDYRAIHGIEMRDPTADRRLVEALLQLPLTATVHDGHSRALARLLGAGVVPDEIRWRTRRGMQSPEQGGYFALHADRYREAWQQVSATALRELFDPVALGATLERLIAGQGQAGQGAFLHRILDVGLFLDHAAQRWGSTVVFDGERPSRPAGAPND